MERMTSEDTTDCGCGSSVDEMTSSSAEHDDEDDDLNGSCFHFQAVMRSLRNEGSLADESLRAISRLADSDAGWLKVLASLVSSAADTSDPMAPAVVCMFLGQCPLPSLEAVKAVHSSSLKTSNSQLRSSARYRQSVILLLGCLAEKLSGPLCEALFQDVAEFLRSILESVSRDDHPALVLLAIVTLEKFAQSPVNKSKMENWNGDGSGVYENLAKRLQLLHTSSADSSQLQTAAEAVSDGAVTPSDDCDKWIKRQLGFCIHWSLDNIFHVKGHEYWKADVTCVNVRLSDDDVSEMLKLSPDGLEARCDSASFESVRSTCDVISGCWYYEVTVVSDGVMQIGWATSRSKFLNHEGYGVGDDAYSVGYDGCRGVIWHSAKCHVVDVERRWKAGSSLGY